MKKSLDTKLEAMRLGRDTRNDFIIADAKDADMAFGLASGGQKPDGTYRRIDEYRNCMREVAAQGLVDIVLMSASSLEILAKDENLFENSAVTPAARANDTSDIWACRGASYASRASRPFRSADIKCIKACGANLGLYSTTFNNDLDADYASLKAFSAFRLECCLESFKYFWEVFNPNVAVFESAQKTADFVNDCIARTLAGITRAQRPQFLKVAYNGPLAMEALASYDTSMPVGILGGGAGTTYDAFKLLEQAQKYGARVALFGRKINNAESPTDFIKYLRAIADGLIAPEAAVKAYHADLKKQKLKPARNFKDDMLLTQTALGYAK